MIVNINILIITNNVIIVVLMIGGGGTGGTWSATLGPGQRQSAPSNQYHCFFTGGPYPQRGAAKRNFSCTFGPLYKHFKDYENGYVTRHRENTQ